MTDVAHIASLPKSTKYLLHLQLHEFWEKHKGLPLAV